MKIREIRKEEYDQCQQMIYDIFDKCLAKEYSAKGRETFRNIIRFEDKTTWVAEDNNKIIGVSAIIKNTRHMMYLFILPQYQGKKIGTLCTNINNINFKDLKKIMKNKFDSEPIIFKNNENFKKIGIISGAAGSLVIDALKENCDTFITGETKEGSPALAKEAGINIIYMGHYNSEKIGIIKWKIFKKY